MQRIVAQHVVQAMKKQAGLKPKTKQWRGMFHLMYAVKQQIVNITKTIIVLHINVKPSKNKDFGSTECASFELR